jgi:hypothetical protein
MAEPALLSVIDTYSIELIHPWREGRSKQQIGRKGKSNGPVVNPVNLAWSTYPLQTLVCETSARGS